MMIDKKEAFKKAHPELIDSLKELSKEERDTLCGVIHDYEEDTRPRYSCKRGDVVRFWSTWTDYSKGIYLERLERVAIALDDCENVLNSVMLEYSVPDVGTRYGCWRYERVDAEKFIAVIGHVDLSEWEAYAEKLWEVVKHE